MITGKMGDNDRALKKARENTEKLEAVRTAAITDRAKDHFGIRNIESVKSLFGIPSEAERLATSSAVERGFVTSH
jgi:hypothetical protein